MKSSKYLILFVLYLLSSQLLFGQEPTSRIEKLNIASISAGLSIYGTSISSDTWGRFFENSYQPWFNVHENSAYYFGISTPQINLQLAPGQNYGLTKVLKMSSLVNKKIDDNTKNYRSDDLNIKYPAIDIQFSRNQALPEGMICFPVKKYTVGLLFHRAMLISMNLDITGMETSITTELNAGGATNKITLNNYFDGTNSFFYSVTNAGFFITGKIKNRFIASLKFEKLYYELRINSNLNIQGSMFFNGREYLFNDSGTLWPTDISQTLLAKYNGSNFRMNIGGIFAKKPELIFDAVISASSNANLGGNLTGERNKIPALNLDAIGGSGGVEEILDAEKLDLDQLTATESVGWKKYSNLKHTVPLQIKIGILYRINKWSFYLSDRFYIGSYRFLYGDDYLEINPKIKLKLYISRGGFFSKLGIFAFKYYAPESQDLSYNSTTLPVPFVSVGYGKKILNRTVLIGNLDILLIPSLNIGMSYHF